MPRKKKKQKNWIDYINKVDFIAKNIVRDKEH